MTNIRGTLIGVYNADGGIVGELTYVLGHLIGVRSFTVIPAGTGNDFLRALGWGSKLQSL